MTLPSLPTGFTDALRAITGPDRVDLDLEVRMRASRDFAWISPILVDRLPADPADVVVRPATVDQVVPLVRLAALHRIPVTVRGRGTGNYGQAVPLARGLVIDLADCHRIRGIDGDGAGAVTDVEAGVAFSQIERAAQPLHAEVAVMPSTVSSTVGGFLAGGNQGIGSIEHGSIWDGWVESLDIVGCTPDAEPFTVSGDEIRPHLHTYGTGGIILGARLRLAPRRRRTVVFATFDDVTVAAEAGRAMMRLDPPPRALSLDDPALAPALPAHAGVIAGTVNLRVSIPLETATAVRAIVERSGGRVTAVDRDAMASLYASVYNHATVRAKRLDPELCAVQVRGRSLIEHGDAVRACLPDARLHLDGNAPAVHGIGYSGLLLSRWVDADTLAAGCARLRELGVIVIDPHTWVLGGHGGVDRIRAVAERIDPYGLLNPGKLPAV